MAMRIAWWARVWVLLTAAHLSAQASPKLEVTAGQDVPSSAPAVLAGSRAGVRQLGVRDLTRGFAAGGTGQDDRPARAVGWHGALYRPVSCRRQKVKAEVGRLKWEG